MSLSDKQSAALTEARIELVRDFGRVKVKKLAQEDDSISRGCRLLYGCAIGPRLQWTHTEAKRLVFRLQHLCGTVADLIESLPAQGLDISGQYRDCQQCGSNCIPVDVTDKYCDRDCRQAAYRSRQGK